MSSSEPPASAARILQAAFAFWPAKVLLSAAELDVFTLLGEAGLSGTELIERLGLVPRAGFDFLDALVAMGFLLRDGDGPHATYRNTRSTAVYLDRNSPSYLGGALAMANSRLYGFWAGLTQSLRTGRPQSEAGGSEAGRTGPLFDVLYHDPDRAEQFARAMAGVSLENFRMLADAFDFGPYQTLCDVGGATGQLSVILASRYRHLRCTTLDLPAMEPIARRTVTAAGLDDRITVGSVDFFTDPLPAADVITMSLVLHDWDLERKRRLIASAFAALPPGGAYLVLENLIDDERRVNSGALLSSLNMLIEVGDAFEFTIAEFRHWCTEAGFKRVTTMPLAGSTTAAIAYK